MTPFAATLLTIIAITLIILLAYRDLIQQRRITELSETVASLHIRCAMQRQRANALKMSIDRHVAAKDRLLGEMALLERKYAHLCVRRVQRSTGVRVAGWKIRGQE